MEAQNIVADRRFGQRRYQVTRVVTFGSPKTAVADPKMSVNYVRFAAIGDPVVNSVFWRRFDNTDQIFVGGVQPMGDLSFGINAHLSYRGLDDLLKFDALGARSGQHGSWTKLLLDDACYCTFPAPPSLVVLTREALQRSGIFAAR
jgi:hypothetical protein